MLGRGCCEEGRAQAQLIIKKAMILSLLREVRLERVVNFEKPSFFVKRL